MSIMTDNAALEQSIADNAYALLELEYYLGQLPDISDLEARLSAMELKQMELMMQLTTNDNAITGFNETLGDETMGLIKQINDLKVIAAEQKVQIEGDDTAVPPVVGLTQSVTDVMLVAMDQATQI